MSWKPFLVMELTQLNGHHPRKKGGTRSQHWMDCGVFDCSLADWLVGFVFGGRCCLVWFGLIWFGLVGFHALSFAGHWELVRLISRAQCKFPLVHCRPRLLGLGLQHHWGFSVCRNVSPWNRSWKPDINEPRPGLAVNGWFCSSLDCFA